MKTLIELYDERPLENVLAAEVFRPERVVYICPRRVAADAKLRSQVKKYFEHRGQSIDIVSVGVGVYDAQALLRVMREVVGKYEDCAIDITGGSESALFAVGYLSAETQVPVFTYSRRRNRFFTIHGEPFEGEPECRIKYKVEDFFIMAGGSMHRGRVDNSVLGRYYDCFEPFFYLYLNNRRSWNRAVTYIQKVSQVWPGDAIPLSISAPYRVKGERSAMIEAPDDILRAYEKIGFIRNLVIDKGKSVSFTFKDEQVRTWMRDVGSVLELYIYKLCIDAGMYDDVRTSVIVDWDGNDSRVSNELDVMCTYGVIPVFISCKTCDVKTEALNELAILRDRFGGQMAKAAIVTAERGGSAMRSRAAELGISVIDLTDLSRGKTAERIKVLIK